MVSMLCFSYGVLPLPVPICSLSTRSTLRGTKLHFRDGHTSSSLARGYSTHHPLWRNFCPVILASDTLRKPARNNENSNKFARVRVGASLVLACAIGIGILSAILKYNPKAIAGPRELYQKAPQVHENPYESIGKSSLQSLLDVSFYLASKDTEPKSPAKLPARPSAAEVFEFKMEALQIMKKGKPEEAVTYLESLCMKYRSDPEPAYNVEMVLVEILICLRDYERALRCDCLRYGDQLQPSDARIPLYKAIIYTMLDQQEEAKKHWEKYFEFVEGGTFGPFR